MRSSARTVAAVVVTAVLAVAGSACSDSGSKSSTPKTSSAKTVNVHSGKLGKFLVGGGGKTLYLFLKDKTSASTCSGDCAKAWPPMKVKGKPVAGSGVQKSLLGTNGTKQVTYKGHPLYYFQGDAKAGQTNGQGLNQFGAKWYVVGTDGKEIKAKSKGGGGGGGGY